MSMDEITTVKVARQVQGDVNRIISNAERTIVPVISTLRNLQQQNTNNNQDSTLQIINNTNSSSQNAVLLSRCNAAQSQIADLTHQVAIQCGILLTTAGTVTGGVGPDIAAAAGIPLAHSDKTLIDNNDILGADNALSAIYSDATAAASLAQRQSTLSFRRVASILQRLLVCDVTSRFLKLSISSIESDLNSVSSSLKLDVNTGLAAWILQGVAPPATIMVLNVALAAASVDQERILSNMDLRNATNNILVQPTTKQLLQLIQQECESNSMMMINKSTIDDSRQNDKKEKYIESEGTKGKETLDDMLGDLGDWDDDLIESQNSIQDNENGDKRRKDDPINLLNESMTQCISRLIDAIHKLFEEEEKSTSRLSNGYVSRNFTALENCLESLISSGYLKLCLESCVIHNAPGPWRTLEEIQHPNVIKQDTNHTTMVNGNDLDDDDMFSVLPMSVDTKSSQSNTKIDDKFSAGIALITLTKCAILLDTLVNMSSEISLFVESQMVDMAPNLSILLGSDIAAELISLAGGIESLVKVPACNILVMGAKRTGVNDTLGLAQTARDKHGGIIWRAPLIASLPQDIQRKVARTLSAKVALATRFDFVASRNRQTSLTVSKSMNSTDEDAIGTQGLRLREEVERQIDLHMAPPPVKKTKALPIPDEIRKKRRGGKRMRKYKEKMRPTKEQEERNRIHMNNAGEVDVDGGVDFDEEL